MGHLTAVAVDNTVVVVLQNFIVRKCSQTAAERSTAISVKLGYEHGFVVDHFVITTSTNRWAVTIIIIIIIISTIIIIIIAAA